MVTIDNMVENVGVFKGDLEKERRNYERAKQGAALLKGEKAKLEDSLRLWTGFHEWNLPEGAITQEINRGEVTFTVKSHATTKRPQYKTAATELENYLCALNSFALRNEARPGLIVESRRAYIATGTLLERTEEIIEGILKPAAEHEISYDAPDPIKAPIEMEIIPDRAYRLKPEDFADYVRMDRLQTILEDFKKAYEKQFRKQNKGKTVVAVTSRTGYEQKSQESEGVDWAYVVKRLITPRTADTDEEGELEILADQGIGIAEKKQEMPWYDIIRKDINGLKTLYVGVQSVYDRIQELKGEESVKSRREKLVLTEVV